MATKPFDALEIIASIESESAKDVQRVAVAILSAVVVGTPVGNPDLWQNPASAPPGYVGGHARRNWQVSLGVPLTGGGGGKGRRGRGPGAEGAKSEAINKGKGRIRNFKTEDRRLIIQNNVPYIVPLNNGHSTQAPKNFVEKAVQVGRNIARNERKDLP